MPPSLLVVDHDLGFAFWLAKMLDCVGYATFPARDVHDALILLRSVPGLEESIRLIVIDDGQADGERLIQHCRRRAPGVHTLWLHGRAGTAPADDLDPARLKPANQTAEECKDLLVAIGRLLAAGPRPQHT